MKKRGVFSRSRGIDDFNNRVKRMDLVQFIRQKMHNKKFRLLEIGAGEGRLLMELSKEFPHAHLVGINKAPWPAMRGSMSLKKTGTFYGIFTPTEVNHITLPKIYFCNAEKLPFSSNYFDFIVSQVAFPYIIRKDYALEETWRALRKGGIAILNFDYQHPSYPPSITGTVPRFVIRRNEKTISSKQAFRQAIGSGFKIKMTTQKRGDARLTTVTMVKNTSKRLHLHLVYDPLLSFSLSKMARNAHKDPVYWGHRSVFNIKN